MPCKYLTFPRRLLGGYIVFYVQNTVLDLSRRALYYSLLEILIIIFFTKTVVEKRQSVFVIPPIF